MEDTHCRVKFFKNAEPGVLAFGGHSMTYLELIVLFSCMSGPRVSVNSSVGLSVPIFADLLLLSLFPALTCSGVSVSIWISVHSINDDIEINFVLGLSLVANCVSGSSLKVAEIFAGTIWTWQTTFLVIMFCSSTLLMDMELPTFPAIALVRALVERRQSCSK